METQERDWSLPVLTFNTWNTVFKNQLKTCTLYPISNNYSYLLRALKPFTFSLASCSCLCNAITSCFRVSFSCCVTRRSDFSRDIWRLVLCRVSSRLWTCKEQEHNLAFVGPRFPVGSRYPMDLGSLMEGVKLKRWYPPWKMLNWVYCSLQLPDRRVELKGVRLCS